MFSYLIERGLIARIDRPRLRLGQSRRPGGAKITHSSQRTSTKVKQRTQSSSRAEPSRATLPDSASISIVGE